MAAITGGAPVGVISSNRKETPSILNGIPRLANRRIPARPSAPASPIFPRHVHVLVRASASPSTALDLGKNYSQEYQPIKNLCSAAFTCISVLAVWSIIASAFSASGLFASLSLSTQPGSPQGLQLAIQSAWAGVAAGFLHTLCGPDHLAALTPLTIGRGRGAATALGALWGFGHSTGQLILGLMFVFLKERFTDLVPALSKWAGTVIGLTLIAIGLMGIYETYFEKHDAEEPELQLAVAGAGAAGPNPSVKGGGALKLGFTTYATGIVYGLQPDALFVVIPALALPTKLAAIAYCTMFVIGTVAAMGGYTALIGKTSEALTKERPWLQAHLSTIASAVAIVVGVAILLSGHGLHLPFFQ